MITYTNGDWDEHETGLAGVVALALLVDDGKGNEEHVQQTVQDRHVERDQEDDQLGE